MGPCHWLTWLEFEHEERIMKAHSLCDLSASSYMTSKKTLKLNPQSLIIKELRKKVAKTEVDKSVGNLTYLLSKTVPLVSGFALEKPTGFTKVIHRFRDQNGGNEMPPLEGGGASALEEID
ncbi:heat shock protein 90 [Serendipita sp. 401]|nr:heat shock protein 90 [Serendipita sp. 401]KAG9055318.1 heat shock protein 90 [Serendipita sp. 407]